MTTTTTTIVATALCLGLQSFVATNAWAPPSIIGRASSSSSPWTKAKTRLSVEKNSWSVVDDWSSLSSEHEDNAIPDSSTIFNQDMAANAAREFEALEKKAQSPEDLWINDIVDEIQNGHAALDAKEGTPALYDTSFEEASRSDIKVENYLDDMGKEIAMLVRCNEHPEELLISEGRAVAALTEEEKDDVSQLVEFLTNDQKAYGATEFRATTFLKHAVSQMFHLYATPDKVDGVLCMKRPEIAKWMTRALQEKYPTSSHDSRVLKTISDYGSYGSGRLVEDNFQQLYLSAIIGDLKKVKSSQVSPERHLQLRHPFVQSVWRDIRNHGMLAPVELERKKLAAEIKEKHNSMYSGVNPLGEVTSIEMELLDECEILDWDYRPDDVEEPAKREASGERNSHKSVDLVPNTDTPVMVRDGDFVFIDEESCIGCMQCANVAPNSFLMLDNGRARTFKQRNGEDVRQAVASCPVNCMHPVSYPELKEYETARDEGDGRTDHKHLGHRRGHTPLYVAGIDSDNNHRTSWYHTLKGQCVVSSQCPQKGCYDCPTYGKPGNNPYYKERQRKDEHLRAQFFLDRGDIDDRRKICDL